MTSIKAVLEDLLGDRGLSVEEAAARHYGPEFRQRTNGEWADCPDVLTRLSALRATTTDVQITVLDELVDGHRYAERHIIELRTTEGNGSARRSTSSVNSTLTGTWNGSKSSPALCPTR